MVGWTWPGDSLWYGWAWTMYALFIWYVWAGQSFLCVGFVNGMSWLGQEGEGGYGMGRSGKKRYGMGGCAKGNGGILIWVILGRG